MRHRDPRCDGRSRAALAATGPEAPSAFSAAPAGDPARPAGPGIAGERGQVVADQLGDMRRRQARRVLLRHARIGVVVRTAYARLFTGNGPTTHGYKAALTVGRIPVGSYTGFEQLFCVQANAAARDSCGYRISGFGSGPSARSHQSTCR